MAFVEHRTDDLPEADQILHLSEGRISREDRGPLSGRSWGHAFPRLPQRRGRGEALATLNDVGFRWSRSPSVPPLLEGVDLELRREEVTVLRGSNGSGKTTLLRLIAGARKPTSGHLQRGEGCRLAYLPQNPEHLFVSYTVREELREAARSGGGAARGAGCAERLGLGRLLEANPFELSSGQKRRLNVAIVLATGASLVLLDEPTFGLDEAGVGELIRLIGELREAGAGVLTATHDAAFANAVGDRLLTLDHGRVVEETVYA